MDAKKKAAIVKPLYLGDTRAYKYARFVYIGVLVYTAVAGYLTYKYFRSHPNRYYNTNPVAQYYNSQEFLLKEAKLIGILPPTFKSKIDINKLEKSIPRGSAQDFDA